MYLSSTVCLRKIKEGISNANYSVDDQEIKKLVLCVILIQIKQFNY